MITVSARQTHRWVAFPLLFVLALTLSGCVRVHTALAVSADDIVSGEITVATLAAQDADTGPALTIPQELSDRITATPYNADGYVGQVIKFEQFSFDEVGLLATSITSTSSRYRLNLRRSGDLVSLSGSADLNQLPTNGADFQLEIAFPGPITRTNGVIDGATVSWTPKPGAVTEFTATSRYTNAPKLSWTEWVFRISAVAVGVALLVMVLALIAHRRSRRELTSAG